jgi:hypothetical protein
MKHIKKFEGSLFKKYVYKYDNYYLYMDDVIGEMLVLDIEDARTFSEKNIKYFDVDKIVNNLDMVLNQEDEEIKITHPFEKIEI